MKTISILFIILCTTLSFTQTQDISSRNEQKDDIYLAGDTIIVDAAIRGDLVAAGRQLVIDDSIYGDLTAAGANLSINRLVADDVRIAVGRIVVDAEIGDDLVVFAGEVLITENATIRGNLICFANDVEIDGKVIGKIDVKGSNVIINGEIHEASKIISEDITVGSNAKFYKDVHYWSSDEQIDFGESLINSRAQFDEALKKEKSSFSLLTFGMTSFPAWIFYILSVFLVILLLHGLFRNAFSEAVVGLEENYLKSLGYGLIYLIGVPLVIAIVFLIGIGIPLGLFMTGIFIFSLLVGHFISALVIVYYIRHKNEMTWSFWSVTLLALLFTIGLRLLASIPFVGILISIAILTITYGALTLKALHAKELQA